jgi:hypothetical protein
MAAIIALKVNGTEYEVDLDLDEFTAGELNGVERNTGMKWLPWIKALTDRNVSSLAWTALAWIAVRRAGSFTPFDEFEDSLKLMELVTAVDPDGAAPVVEAAQAARKRKPPRA